jgi:microfibrillar-associated protein 1
VSCVLAPILSSKLKKNAPKEKQQWKFMQKYYHKGVFYMDESSVREKEDVRKRDASGATLEDKFNKEMLPQVMQVKNFGRAGR